MDLADALTIDEPASQPFVPAAGADAGGTAGPGSGPAGGGAPAPQTAPAGRGGSRWLRHAPIAAVLAFASVLYVHLLGQNGYANTFYSAAVRSMLGSWHNFFFVSFDPAGSFVQRRQAAARPVAAGRERVGRFGFRPLTLLLPEAIVGVVDGARGCTLIVKRRLRGAGRASASAMALAVFPSFAAVARDNNLDALLIAADGARVRRRPARDRHRPSAAGS